MTCQKCTELSGRDGIFCSAILCSHGPKEWPLWLDHYRSCHFFGPCRVPQATPSAYAWLWLWQVILAFTRQLGGSSGGWEMPVFGPRQFSLRQTHVLHGLTYRKSFLCVQRQGRMLTQGCLDEGVLISAGLGVWKPVFSPPVPNQWAKSLGGPSRLMVGASGPPHLHPFFFVLPLC